MNKENAEKYLEKKGIEVNEDEVKKVMKEGKIYGDPIAMCN